jgi:uncharacterized DUF497 family protein
MNFEWDSIKAEMNRKKHRMVIRERIGRLEL